jgi:hypothetical protein
MYYVIAVNIKRIAYKLRIYPHPLAPSPVNGRRGKPDAGVAVSASRR